MGEIDTKSIESVQVALSLFGEKNDQRKYWSIGDIKSFRNTEHSEEIQRELVKERELDLVLKELANYKVQLEVKESAYMQALLTIEICQKTVDELSTQLKNCESQKDKYIEECREARAWIDELEFKMKDASDELLEAEKVQEQLLHAVNGLSSSQEELINLKAELGAAEESKLDALKQLELMETAANVERGKIDELLKHIAELNEAILLSNMAAIGAEKEKSVILSEKEAEIKLAMAAAVQAQEQLEEMRKQINTMQDLENQISAESISIDSLQLEFRQAKEFYTSSAEADSDAILNQLKSELELKKKAANCDEAIYIESMETDLKQLKSDLKNAKEEVDNLNHGVESLTCELQKTRSAMDEIRERESEANVEITMLKCELHKGRSKIAAAEAAEASAKSVKSGLYLAVQQLALEAEETKRETRRLNREEEKDTMDTEFSFLANPCFDDSSECLESSQIEGKIEEQESRDDDDDGDRITISTKEYKALIEKADQVVVSKELETATMEIKQLKSVAEQASSRAELAEKAKTAIEDQLRKYREHRQRRRAALATLGEESANKESNPPMFDKSYPTYQPLGKVLNIKF